MNISKRIPALVLLAALCFGASGCMKSEETPLSWHLKDEKGDAPKLPAGLERGEDGVPTLSVYDVKREKAAQTDVESYIEGVVAGEMKNDWPLEALKAQAVLARTFVLKFCSEKKSKYGDADISTDVSEAQAYAPDSVNARVKHAVEDTRGLVMASDGAFANAWFHAHSGGMTELPSVALDYQGGDPDYLKPAASRESDRAPDNAKAWTATFTTDQVRAACARAGVKVGRVDSVQIGEKGASGRAKTLIVNGESVSAPSFRIQVGANRLRSTLIDSIEVKNGKVTFKGRGFGHGVGLSQWGAYQMAEDGASAGQIIEKYFPGVDVVKLW